MKIRRIFFYVCVLTQCCLQKATAQNISGDTILVNSVEDLQIKFPSNKIDPPKWTNVEGPAPYEITTGPNSIYLIAVNENVKCANLLVYEGSSALRKHSLTVCYTKNTGLKTVDYGTIEKLKNRIKEIQQRDAQNVAVNNTSKTESSPSPNTKAATPPPAAVKPDYTAKLKEGDNALKAGQFDVAQAKYQEVLSVQADNAAAQKGLADVQDRKAKKDLDDKITLIKKGADNAFSAKQYDEAANRYNEVLSLKQGDLYATSQIAAIQKIKADNALIASQEKERAAQREQEDKINGMKEKAAKALNEKRYDDAILGYTDILALNPNDVLSKGRIEAIQKIKEQEKNSRAQDEGFKTLLTQGDQAYKNEEYEVAKASYLAAAKLKNNDPEIDQKIKLTNEKIAIKETEDEYKTAVNFGDEAVKAGDYDKAKTQFARASKMFPNRPYPQEQIKAINSIVGKVEEQKKADAARQAKELEISRNYALLIDKADKAYDSKDYSGAKAFYSQAANVKPNETRPAEKLAEIKTILDNAANEKKASDNLVAAAAAVNKEYSAAMQKGKAAMARKDYDAAKTAYSKAAELKPAEQEPNDQLAFISKQLIGADVDANYNAALAKGNVALGNNNYAAALQSYQEAQRIKPLETSVLNQIRSVRGLMTADSIKQATAQKKEEEKIQDAILKKRFDEGMAAYVSFEKAANTANYEDQLFYLKRFLNIIPDTSEINPNQYNPGAKLTFARERIQLIRDDFARRKGSAFQVEAIPYLDKELEKKYESINFTAPPDDQVMDNASAASADAFQKTAKKILSAPANLSFADSINNVKVTIRSIKFIADTAFYTVLIQNNASSEFLTGAMQMTLNKKNGNAVKNNPFFISAFPIVLPGKEFSIVYAAKALEPDDKDSINFDLSDRLKKNQFHIKISGKAYNQEKKGAL